MVSCAGMQKIAVPPDTPVVAFATGSAADLKPGAQFFIIAAQKNPDGTFSATSINVGRDGAVPPM